MTDSIEIPTENLGSFDHAELEESVPGRLQQRDRLLEIALQTFYAQILQCTLLSQSLGCTFIELVTVENPEFAVEISTLSVIIPEM